MDKTRTCRICKKEKKLTDFYMRENGNYRTECKLCQKERTKNWYAKTYPIRKAKVEEYRTKNRTRILEKQREYYIKNRDKILERHYRQRRWKKDTDPIFREIERVRWMLQGLAHEDWHYQQKKNAQRKEYIETILGCSIAEFKKHLLKTWEDEYGHPWDGELFHIDHIVPLNTAKSVSDVISLCHYSNLRMITPQDNLTRPKN